MLKKCVGSLVVAIALFLLATNSMASFDDDDATSSDAPPKYTLPLIVTTAFRESEKFFSTVEEITAQQLWESNATTVAEALDLLPGLYTGVARVGHGEYVFLRGFEQQHLLILVDGVPVYDPYDGLLELDHLPVDQIQSIRVLKGSGSSQYGPNALGGVIHIITRDASGPPHQDATVQVGENGTFGFRLDGGWQIGPWRMRLSGSRSQSDGFRLPDGYSQIHIPNLPSGQGTLTYEDGGWRDNSDYVKEAAHVNLTYLPGSSLRLDLSGSLVDNQWGVPPHPIFNPEKNKSQIRYWRFDQWKQGLLNLTASARPREGLWAQTVLYYNTYDNTLDGYDDDAYVSQDKPYAFHSIYDDHTIGGHLHLTADLGRVGDMTLGAGLSEDVHRNTPDRDQPTDEYQNRTWWLAADDHIRLSERISAAAGINVAFQNRIKAPQLSTVGDDPSAINPRLALGCQTSPSTRVYLSWSQMNRFPTMKQLYGQDGNARLKSQRSSHLELGSEWSRTTEMQIRGSLFIDWVKDLIEGNYTSAEMTNIDRALLCGGELTVQVIPIPALRCLLSYSFLWAGNKSEVRPGDRLQYRPEHQLNWTLSARLPWSTAVHLDGSAFSRRYFYDDFHDRRLSHLSPYAVANLTLRRRFSFGIEPFVAIKNIFDADYQNVHTSPAPGREIVGGMELSW